MTVYAPASLPRVRIEGDGPELAMWLPPKLFAAHFTTVAHHPDFVLSLVSEGSDLSFIEEADSRGYLPVALCVADRWDGATAWHDRLRTLVAQSRTIVFGPQLPVSVGYDDRLHPMLYPSTMESIRPPGPALARDLDLVFLGDFIDDEARDDYQEPPPLDGNVNSRSRHARSEAVRMLRHRLRHRRLLIERRSFWRSGYDGAGTWDMAWLVLSYRRALMRAAVCFSPPGKGYNCVRHSDILAVGGLLLCPPIHKLVRVPEPAAWADEKICVTYALDASNLIEVADRAIEASESLQDLRAAARSYYQRHATAEARVRYLARTLAAYLA